MMERYEIPMENLNDILKELTREYNDDE